MEFTNKQDRNYANTRKIITSLTNDVRVILIKLADRLHNMRTLSFKKENKQKDISIETMEIFVPLAYNIGAYQIKTELEDLSLSYLKPQEYKKTKEETDLLLIQSEGFLKEMLDNISRLLNDKNVPNEIKIRVRNIYGIYRRRCEGQEMRNIHDLLALKVIVNEVASCYLSLGYIHSLYKPINSKFKDCICNPKTNMYQCLHTTVFGPEDMLVQAQIRTHEMDMIDSYGIAAYWNLKKENASEVMQEVLENKCQFFKSLVEIDEQYTDNRKFVEQVKKELLSGNVYVYTSDGVVLQLPAGSTPVDFAYMIDPMNASKFVTAYVNDRKVADDYILQNKDRVRILTSKKSLPKEEWKDSVQTTRALTLIKKEELQRMFENQCDLVIHFPDTGEYQTDDKYEIMTIEEAWELWEKHVDEYNEQYKDIDFHVDHYENKYKFKSALDKGALSQDELFGKFMNYSQLMANIPPSQDANIDIMWWNFE